MQSLQNRSPVSRTGKSIVCGTLNITSDAGSMKRSLDIPFYCSEHGLIHTFLRTKRLSCSAPIWGTLEFVANTESHSVNVKSCIFPWTSEEFQTQNGCISCIPNPSRQCSLIYIRSSLCLDNKIIQTLHLVKPTLSM